MLGTWPGDQGELSPVPRAKFVMHALVTAPSGDQTQNWPHIKRSDHHGPVSKASNVQSWIGMRVQFVKNNSWIYALWKFVACKKGQTVMDWSAASSKGS